MGAGYGVTGTAKTRAGTKSALDMAVWTALDTKREAWKGEAYLQRGSEYCDFHSGHAEFFKYCNIFRWTIGSEPIMNI